MTTNSPAGNGPVDCNVMPHGLHSDEAMERAAITLRQMTQERRGQGISAVMMFEEQVRDLTKQIHGMRAALRDIAKQDPIEMALDPQWAARVARITLTECGYEA